MAFLGRTVKDGDETLLLNTAEPSAQEPSARPKLALAGHPSPRVLVLDTGLRTSEMSRTRTSTGIAREAEHPRLKDIELHQDWTSSAAPGVVDDEDEEFDPPPPTSTDATRAQRTSRLLDFEAGHGTFIAGLISQLCPDAIITTAGVLSSFGDGDVSGVLASFERIVNLRGPFDIVVMSFGTNLVDDEPGLFGDGIMTLLDGALGVAAAGNQSTCRPYFPAALPKVIGVGALASDGKAWFTNFGGWVDACAPGIDVLSTFFCDFTEQIDGQDYRRYEGFARWSGTSFAAPKVAAVVAQEMYLYGGTAMDAWKRLTSHRHFRYPDLGIVFNV
jgi:subtilisin family serine protease